MPCAQRRPAVSALRAPSENPPGPSATTGSAGQFQQDCALMLQFMCCPSICFDSSSEGSKDRQGLILRGWSVARLIMLALYAATHHLAYPFSPPLAHEVNGWSIYTTTACFGLSRGCWRLCCRNRRKMRILYAMKCHSLLLQKH